MSIARLRERVAAALSDPELMRLGAGLRASARLRCDGDTIAITLHDGLVRLADDDDTMTSENVIDITASGENWDKVLASPPPPTFHAFTALALANPTFEISGDPLVLAQARAVLERLFERITATPAATAPAVEHDLGLISGGYHRVSASAVSYDIFVEKSGHDGPPLLLLHTAGADARQFQAQLADSDLSRGFRMVAPDLPFHGRSMPPRNWDGGPYRLTADRYLGWCVAIIEQIIGEPAFIAGGSMGAGIALLLAATRPDLVRGVVAIEPPFQSKGRRNPYQHHVAVHAGLHNASFVRGLMSPTSPEADRRRAAWIYSQGAPGIYSGDLAFYSEEFDGAMIAPRIDTNATPIALLCGIYDYSATPADGRKLQALIPGARLDVMDGLGHFPMCEHPDLFRPYFRRALDHVSGKSGNSDRIAMK